MCCAQIVAIYKIAQYNNINNIIIIKLYNYVRGAQEKSDKLYAIPHIQINMLVNENWIMLLQQFYKSFVCVSPLTPYPLQGHCFIEPENLSHSLIRDREKFLFKFFELFEFNQFYARYNFYVYVSFQFQSISL